MDNYKKHHVKIDPTIVKILGKFFDLDECEQAIGIAKSLGFPTFADTWIDYSKGEDWDREAYYSDFEKWWSDTLTDEQSIEIYLNMKFNN